MSKIDLKTETRTVRPDWVIYCISGNLSKPVATIILTTFLGNFCKAVKIFHFTL